MAQFAILSDSSCDLPVQTAKKNHVGIIPLKVSFDRVNKLAEGVDIHVNEFYDRLKTSPVVPKTYFPTVREYTNAFKAVLSQGQDVLCLCLSAKLSKAYECACNAREIMSHAFKNNKVMVMDTQLATGAQAALTLSAVKLRDLNCTIEEAYRRLTVLRDNAVTIFTVGSLEQLARGGRMSKATAAIGTLLHINPIIHMEKGELISREKAIGRAKAVHMIKQLAIDAIGNRTNDYEFSIFHSRVPQEAQQIEQDLRVTYNVKFFNPILEIGASIGAHTGVTALAINCMRKV